MTQRISDILPPPDQTVGEGAREARYWTVDDRILVCRPGPFGTVEAIERCDALAEELASRGKRIYLVNDWFDIRTYEPKARQIHAAWALKQRSKLVRAYYLARSKVLIMGLHVVGLTTFTAGLHVYTDPTEFLKDFQELRAFLRAK